MGINFTSDIDGATSGSGLKKITVGGKIINLVEVSGSVSGGGVQSGSFTPDENCESYSFETSSQVTNVIVLKKEKTPTSGVRSTGLLLWLNSGEYGAVVDTNVTGSSWASAVLTCGRIAVTGNTVTLTAYDYFLPEEYIWYAW